LKQNIAITVLGVDPGLNCFGYGAIFECSGAIKALKYGQYVISKKLSFEDKLVFIGKTFDTIIEEIKPDVVAIERIYVAKNTRIALSIGLVSGIIAYSGIVKNVKVCFITPGEIKKTITGNGQALKHQVGFMVQKMLGINEQPGEHATDALATAISFLSVNKFQTMVEML